MDYLFNDEEIIDLMQHLVGDRGQLQICQRITTPGQPDYGIPESVNLICRPVWGYLLNDDRRGIFLGDTLPSGSGNPTAILSAKDVPRDQIKPDTRIVVGEKSYQIEYVRGILDAGKVRLHEIRLNQTAETTAHQSTIRQPDSILEFGV